MISIKLAIQIINLPIFELRNMINLHPFPQRYWNIDMSVFREVFLHISFSN